MAQRQPRTAQRFILDHAILPWFASLIGDRPILIVGVAHYTDVYKRLLPTATNLWTIDVDPERSVYGSSNHIVDRISRLGEHIGALRFSLILVNGIEGVGGSSKDEADAGMVACVEALAPRGVLVHGYNPGWPHVRAFEDWAEVLSDPDRRDAHIHSPALDTLQPYTFPPFQTSVLDVRSEVSGWFPGVTHPLHYRHVYRFYVRSEGPEP